MAMQGGQSLSIDSDPIKKLILAKELENGKPEEEGMLLRDKIWNFVNDLIINRTIRSILNVFNVNFVVVISVDQSFKLLPVL
jgi:hypothetical protein